MTHPLRLGLALLLAGSLGAAGFMLAGPNAQGATHQSSTRASVSVRKTKLGAILVNAKGHTLYLFTKDKRGRSSCTGSCATYWPPAVTRGKPTAGPGIKRTLLGTTTRSDGRRQLTYNHHPLYGFALDKRAGQTNGEGLANFGARWWAVSGRGIAVTAAATATVTGTTTTYGATTTSEETTTSRYP